MEGGERDEVVLVVLINVENGVTDLLLYSLALSPSQLPKYRTLTLMVRENEAFCAL